MHYSVKYPKNLHSLILLNTAPTNYEGQKAFLDIFMERAENIINEILPLFSYEEFKKQDAKEIADLYKKVFSMYFYNLKGVDSLNLVFDVDAVKSGFKVNQEMSKTSWLVLKIDLLPKLRELNIPTLIVHSEQDIVLVWTAKEISSAIESSKLFILEDCGHFPYIEKPNEFKDVVDSFINALAVIE